MNTELYDLENDISETVNVAAEYPEVVTQLLKHAERARSELGDHLTKREGTGNRPVGTL